jgi:hypothetical protein
VLLSRAQSSATSIKYDCFHFPLSWKDLYYYEVNDMYLKTSTDPCSTTMKSTEAKSRDRLALLASFWGSCQNYIFYVSETVFLTEDIKVIDPGVEEARWAGNQQHAPYHKCASQHLRSYKYLSYFPPSELDEISKEEKA